jgi:hypothetical protein
VKRVLAFANIPTEVLGKAVNIPSLPLRSLLKGVFGHATLLNGLFDNGLL